MPELPTGALSQWFHTWLGAIAPAHAPYFAARMAAWQQAPTAREGLSTVMGTLGMRLSPLPAVLTPTGTHIGVPPAMQVSLAGLRFR